ncbi:ABC transporter substrate-binding protein [Chengkuizengella axinellae]|uniref:ABC transporter substrate-binding protein n=1 Tax=Chengkuizengella axinellae TaxID=3064388 RepID=A0ABT9J102_9BACL|nr:ABC transporter substrate-binding protein [Chengkuizengella sp. 2205SS18-9]MDP5275158.1 ABC transporter substrate-binding protein [Chengkuizengella sp. 2205SS18-9]
MIHSLSKRIMIVFSIFLMLQLSACNVWNDYDYDFGNIATNRTNTDSVVELTVWLWDGSGLEDLIREYDLQHDDVNVNTIVLSYEDTHYNLQTAFAAGYGAPDISLVEVSYLERFKEFDKAFYDLTLYGGQTLKDQYLDWKWQQASNRDGFLFGLPTDIGPVAMLYNRSLFKKAGLPTDRRLVSMRIKTWDDLFEVGEILKEHNIYMIDNIYILYRVILGQGEQQYFEEGTNKLIVDTNPNVKKAWDYAVIAKEMGFSRGAPQLYEPQWGEIIRENEFAITFATSWMLSIIEDALISNNTSSVNVSKLSEWDVTYLPEGGGNWGGSFLTMPKEGKHPREAYKLIEHLTSLESQLRVFTKDKIFPSASMLYDDPIILETKLHYFNNAPVGEIFTESAEKLEPVYEGPYQHFVTEIIDDALLQVDQYNASPEDAWDNAMQQIKSELIKK